MSSPDQPRIGGWKRTVLFLGVGMALSAAFGWVGLIVILVLWATWEVAG